MHGTPKYTQNDTHLHYANPDAPKGGTLTLDAIGSFDTLNPYNIKGTAAKGLNLVFDRLMARVWDEPFTMYPLIAERVEVPDDRSSITVHINPKARFHDGTAITADDVIFSFETLKEKGRPNMRQIYKLVKTVEKRGALTVHFAFGEGYDRETAMIVAMMPVLSKAYWTGKAFDQTTLEMPLQSGPYKITQIDPGKKIVLERVKDYWAADLLTAVGHNNFDRIVYDYYRDDHIAFEAFKAGEIGLRREYDAGKWESAYDFPALFEGKVIKEGLSHGRPEKVRALIFNTRRAPFDDIRVRKAFNLLLDADWINKNLYHGKNKRIESYFANSELAATGSPSPAELAILEPYRAQLPAEVFGPAWKAPSSSTPPQLRTNMREADRLLKEAGWLVVDGKRVKDGKPFKFEILLGAPEDEKIALNFKRTLDKMGIEVVIRVLDTAAFTGRLNEYDYDMTLYFWLSTLSPGTEQPLYWGCAAADQPSRWNFAGVCNPAIDSLAGSIASAKTREDLVARVHALDRILMHGQYMIPLFYGGEDYVSYWKPVQKPTETPLYGMVLETWWMNAPPAAKQD